MGVYVIRNLASGEVYIGSSNNIRHRTNTHRQALRRGKHWLERLQAAWDALGEEAFEFAVMETVDSLEQIRPCEQKHLDAVRPYTEGIGYNRSPSTLGAGWRYTDEQRARLSEAHRGRQKSAEHRAALWVNRVVTSEHRARMSALGKMGRGVPKSTEQNRKNSEANRGANNPGAKLDEAKVGEILRRLALGERGAHLAAEFGVSGVQISRIKNRRIWTHVVAAPEPQTP